MVSPVTVVKCEGPKLVPFFKATCVYFVLWLPTSSPSWFSALIKCLPIFCLWVFLLAHGVNFLISHGSAKRIFAGLIFSAVGDAFLIWQEQGYFVHELGRLGWTTTPLKILMEAILLVTQLSLKQKKTAEEEYDSNDTN